MNRYETIFILDPDMGGDDQETIFEKLRSMIAQGKGTLLMFDDWGDRKFAYEIKKKLHGRYVRLDYCGDGNIVNDIERFFHLDYRILKFMTILLDRDVDVEALKMEMETAQEPAETDQDAASEADDTTDTEDAEDGEDAKNADTAEMPEGEEAQEAVQAETEEKE